MAHKNAKRIFNQFNPDLVRSLPLKDPYFIAELTKQDLFFGSLKGEVITAFSPADAATIFLYKAIEHPLDVGNEEPFDKLLLVMEKFADSTINKLAKEIKQKLNDSVPLTGNLLSSITGEEVENQNKTSSLNYDSIGQPLADLQVNEFRKTMKWEELALLPVCRSACYAVPLGGYIYVGSGFEGRNYEYAKKCYRLDVYNLTTNQWSSSPITTPYCLFAMTVLDDKLVTAGGETKNDEAVKKVLVLNDGQWKDYSEMPTARCHATAVGYHSMLIVVGGNMKVGGEDVVVSTTEILDTTNGRWHSCNNLPSPHFQLKAAIINDKVYMLGGFQKGTKSSPEVFFASLDALSSHRLNWQLAQNASPWCLSIPVALQDKLLLAVGGVHESSFDVISDMVYVLNASTGTWSHLINMPSARTGPAVVSMGNKVIVIGGVTITDKKCLCDSVLSCVFD